MFPTSARTVSTNKPLVRILSFSFLASNFLIVLLSDAGQKNLTYPPHASGGTLEFCTQLAANWMEQRGGSSSQTHLATAGGKLPPTDAQQNFSERS